MYCIKLQELNNNIIDSLNTLKVLACIQKINYLGSEITTMTADQVADWHQCSHNYGSRQLQLTPLLTWTCKGIKKKRFANSIKWLRKLIRENGFEFKLAGT